jgi:hypothetical protein
MELGQSNSVQLDVLCCLANGNISAFPKSTEESATATGKSLAIYELC